LIDELQADAETAVVDKTRMDAFHQTNLEAVLRGLSVTRLLIGGVITNACVETTARSAAIRDFDVTVLSDCCTTYSGLDQANSLSGLQGFGLARVMELADLTELRS
jgi:nicotinamidase-related amidase